VGQYLEAFALGNAAILGNVCMLPLYPGLLALLADRAGSERPQRWVGALVLAGVLTVMVAIGAALHLASASAADVLPVLLPVLYGTVIVLGVAMVAGRNPFTTIATREVPILGRPSATAFVYGLLLGPLTLPCTGPLIVSAFVLGGVSGGGALIESLAYFGAFGLGFGWPLVVLPLVAAPLQRRFTRTLASRHHAISVVSGVLLIGVALVGLWTDFGPSA
jgi:cytochrome c-type biogenesis protein